MGRVLINDRGPNRTLAKPHKWFPTNYSCGKPTEFRCERCGRKHFGDQPSQSARCKGH